MERVFGIFRVLRGALEHRWSLGQVTAGLTVSGARDTERRSFHPLVCSSGQVRPGPGFLGGFCGVLVRLSGGQVEPELPMSVRFD